MNSGVNVHLPTVMGHRGAPSLAPENTLLGFKTAFDRGASWTETDVSLLGDGTPVIFHDSTMDRCTDRSGSIADVSLADLPSINANQQHPSAGFQTIPTLDAALECFVELGMGVNLELKLHHHVPPKALVHAVHPILSSGPLSKDRVLLSSFDFDVLRLARVAFPDWAIAVIAENATDEVFDIAKEIDAQALNLWWETLSYDDVRRAKNKGMSVNIWTANDPAKVRSMVDWGVQGFMSDCPQNYHF